MAVEKTTLCEEDLLDIILLQENVADI